MTIKNTIFFCFVSWINLVYKSDYFSNYQLLSLFLRPSVVCCRQRQIVYSKDNHQSTHNRSITSSTNKTFIYMS